MTGFQRRVCALAAATLFSATTLAADEPPIQAPKPPEAKAVGQFRGVHGAVKFDVSPALRDIQPKPIAPSAVRGGSIIDPDGGRVGKPPSQATQMDAVPQRSMPNQLIPAPVISFDATSNLSGVAPPDPAGDVGPNHYVAMSNLSFEVFNKSGVSVFGPAANNTLWSGFGGACETENSGDPIVLYDQLADRWLLTQFTSAGPNFFNCVALSQTSDPTGAYYRWAFTTGTNFPDYPKYGIWTNAYVIATREFAGAYVGVGAYAIDRQAMIVGDPNPTVVDFFVDRTNPALVGDGLLPADIEGFDLPPNNSPAYMVGTQDDGGPYGATSDAINFWTFTIDFVTPANSSFVLTDVLPIASFDTTFDPCSGRSCIPQPGTANRLDIQSYRQRALHRLAYRNFGTHESFVTNQSVEGAPGIAGIRWWEIRRPAGVPTLFQEGTFVPGATDGIHRWMGSAAIDGSGNIAIGYSASSATLFPSVRYSGRLVSDTLGTLDQGEGEIIAGTGSQTGGGNRWGDYTSLNVDPTDDCTFWHVNEYIPTTSERGWRLRVGAFKFDECGQPGFVVNAVETSQAVCAGNNADFPLTINAFGGFDNDVTLSAVGNPVGTSALFSTNPVTTFPGSSTLTIGNTGAVAAGSYAIDINGVAVGANPRTRTVQLNVFAGTPSTPMLVSPADDATNVDYRPSFSWTGSNTQSYLLEVATDAGFSNIVFSTTVTSTSTAPGLDFASNTEHFWRVSPTNICGPGEMSAVFSFITAPAPGDCSAGSEANTEYSYGFESGLSGWTSAGTGNTWAQSTQRVNSGTFSWKAVDPTTTSDQQFVSPPISIPTGQLPLTFQFSHYRDIEEANTTACWDAGALEYTINGGTSWTPFAPAAILADPYTGLVNAGASTNPLAGRSGWCNLQAWTRVIVDASALEGETAQFRFRLGSDGSVGAEGWYIDDVRLQSCGASDSVFKNGFE